MKTAILTSDKESDLQLLLELAGKLGIKTRLLDEEETEDLGLIYAMEEGKTGEFVDTKRIPKQAPVMNIRIDKSFVKDTDQINDRKLKQRIADIIERVQQAKTIQEIQNVKKLKGEQHYYRIKLGDYRIGIQIDKDTVDFIRFLHRKDIYRYFP